MGIEEVREKMDALGNTEFKPENYLTIVARLTAVRESVEQMAAEYEERLAGTIPAPRDCNGKHIRLSDTIDNGEGQHEVAFVNRGCVCYETDDGLRYCIARECHIVDPITRDDIIKEFSPFSKKIGDEHAFELLGLVNRAIDYRGEE